MVNVNMTLMDMNTLQETNISHHCKSKIIFKSAFGIGNMLIPRRVSFSHFWYFFLLRGDVTLGTPRKINIEPEKLPSQ